MPEWPVMQTFEQTAAQPFVHDVAAATRETLDALPQSARIPSGSTVAVAVGSRGIARIDIMAGQVVQWLRDAVRAGIDLVGGPDARIVRIRDTAYMRRFEASEAVAGAGGSRPRPACGGRSRNGL